MLFLCYVFVILCLFEITFRVINAARMVSSFKTKVLIFIVGYFGFVVDRLGFFVKRPLIFVFLLIVSFSPFFTVLCNEILLYSFPLLFLCMFFVNNMFPKLFEVDIEEQEFFLICCELSVLQIVRLVYGYKYGVLFYTFLYKLLLSYLDVLHVGQKLQNDYYINGCRASIVNTMLARKRYDNMIKEEAVSSCVRKKFF